MLLLFRLAHHMKVNAVVKKKICRNLRNVLEQNNEDFFMIKIIFQSRLKKLDRILKIIFLNYIIE